MASRSTPRWRHTAAQLHALEQVQREIHATDPHLRRKYLRDFNSAFRTYDAALTPAELNGLCRSANVLLIGDYHSLPASQNFAADLLRRLSRAGRKLVLGVEFVFAEDQPALDAWSARLIDGPELRRRIRFDTEWGYNWRPFLGLLRAGRDFTERIVALDCVRRSDLSRIVERDRHAAAKLASLRQQHPDAIIVALFGESHLAPNHLPELLRRRRSGDCIVTVLQNIDPLYWRASGEFPERLHAVRVSHDVVCVFNSTPLEKYESYHTCIQRWREGQSSRANL